MKCIHVLVTLLLAVGLAACESGAPACGDAMPDIAPFQNERESVSIDELTMENRLDEVAIYGSLHLTRDKAGLRSARQIKSIIDAVVRALDEDKSLPEHVRIKPAENAANPFR